MADPWQVLVEVTAWCLLLCDRCTHSGLICVCHMERAQPSEIPTMWLVALELAFKVALFPSICHVTILDFHETHLNRWENHCDLLRRPWGYTDLLD